MPSWTPEYVWIFQGMGQSTCFVTFIMSTPHLSIQEAADKFWMNKHKNEWKNTFRIIFLHFWNLCYLLINTSHLQKICILQKSPAPKTTNCIFCISHQLKLHWTPFFLFPSPCPELCIFKKYYWTCSVLPKVLIFTPFLQIYLHHFRAEAPERQG